MNSLYEWKRIHMYITCYSKCHNQYSLWKALASLYCLLQLIYYSFYSVEQNLRSCLKNTNNAMEQC